jgi:hypothetical protein
MVSVTFRKYQVRLEHDGSWSVVYHKDTPGKETLVYASPATFTMKSSAEAFADFMAECTLGPTNLHEWVLIDTN